MAGAEGRGDGRGRVRLVTDDAGGIDAQEPSDLLGHVVEDLGRRRLVRDQRGHPPERRLLLSEHAPRPLQRGRAAAGTGGEGADEDRHHQEHAEHEHGRPVEDAQRREKVPVERQDAHDPDLERVEDPGEVGHGDDEQEEEPAEQRRGHLGTRGRAQQRRQDERGDAHDEGQRTTSTQSRPPYRRHHEVHAMLSRSLPACDSGRGIICE
jgi:hypothetical protein